MNEKIIIKKTAEFVKKKLSSEPTGHDWWHTYRVWKMALKIAKYEQGVDLFVVQIAALLHDIEDWKFNDTGLKLTKRWLRRMNIDEKKISQICEIIKNISFKGAFVKSKVSTKEGMIVQDADRLDAIGAIGIARTFAYGGHKGVEIYNPKIKPKKHKSFVAYKRSRSPTINHFYEKLLLLKNMMNTKTAKKVAIERHKFMKKFLHQFFREWNLKDVE
ncbi:MAG: HD domain-containing protein [Candidatus Parvarchaeota archaeon]|nr:HD domain-containing protein [Candidatus Jingweiarchaeum tengchongense]MCW1298063.1 HD domain-containing protein [Candidatus Jingweiarchaeum tengchongense]MCW1300137.1 HD domain-containing protein [Candidatus Jingweiarchaeum tengchongense]MCW1309686.1 HD domain-containing protein [Candidatus Jingweiarchaeum tengchongense]MCW1310899.1 HD domain-containing protein [Candidatus Jingweiarchaeum tengchongense]